ncbi:MAG: Na/Pi symporter, partial [Firmicutes bacterium]|nr:Na/Pi symporter [Bacillota bacterium]
MLTTTLFGLVGGLGLFLFGVNVMAEGLQKSAGDKMRRTLEVLTNIPLMGVIMGAVITAVTHSSSAITVMVVGFVNAGLMTLKQAVSVIL